jgi:hypothetical protein
MVLLPATHQGFDALGEAPRFLDILFRFFAQQIGVLEQPVDAGTQLDGIVRMGCRFFETSGRGSSQIEEEHGEGFAVATGIAPLGVWPYARTESPYTTGGAGAKTKNRSCQGWGALITKAARWSS